MNLPDAQDGLDFLTPLQNRMTTHPMPGERVAVGAFELHLVEVSLPRLARLLETVEGVSAVERRRPFSRSPWHLRSRKWMEGECLRIARVPVRRVCRAFSCRVSLPGGPFRCRGAA